MTHRTKDDMRSALFEATFVVLGVVLALAANEWRQARADRTQSQRAVDSIMEEIKANRTAVESSMNYHMELLEMLSAEHEDGWIPEVRQFSRGFVSPAQLSRTAWDSASETGALAKTDFETVAACSAVYTQQERYETQASSIGQLIYAQLLDGGTESVARNYRNLASIIGTFAYREQQLLELFDQTLAGVSADNEHALEGT